MWYTKRHHLEHLQLVGRMDEKGGLYLTKKDMEQFLSCSPKVARENFFRYFYSLELKDAYTTWCNLKDNSHLCDSAETAVAKVRVCNAMSRLMSWRKRYRHAKARDDSDKLKKVMRERPTKAW